MQPLESGAWLVYPTPDDLPPVIVEDPAMPLVTVVTPSYNQGRFIRATIESVLEQDYPNIEYWIIDGGSTDETLDILRQAQQDPRLHWLSEADQGQSDAINKGWARSRGDILAYLNSDDTYCDGAIRAQVGFLQAHPEIDAVYGDCLFTDADGKPIERGYGRPFSLRELLRFNIPFQPTVFLRRGAVRQAGPLSLAYQHSMDSEYWLRLHLCGFEFSYNPALIATYRLHRGSKTGATHANAYGDWLRLIEAYAPPDLRDRALADVHLAVAIDAARYGSLGDSWARAITAVKLKPSPRLLLYGLAALDRILGTSLYLTAVRRRNAARGRVRGGQ